MKRLICLTLLASMVVPLVAGCAYLPARGRLSAIDFDLRDKDQIVAYETEATCIYADPTQPGQPLGVGEAPSASPWYLIVDFLKVMKGRLRVLSVEWQK